MRTPAFLQNLSAKKKWTIAISLVLVICCVAGAAYAWLTSQDGPVLNTFIGSDLEITFNETNQSPYQMIPGVDLAKDPTVTLKKGSEPCYIFVEVVKGNEPDNYLTYESDGWTAITSNDQLYWYKQSTVVTTADVTYPILKNNKVTVKSGLEVADLKNVTDVTLSFDVCAVQSANLTFDQALSLAKAEFAK